MKRRSGCWARCARNKIGFLKPRRCFAAWYRSTPSPLPVCGTWEALAIQNKTPEAIDQYKKAEELAPHDTDVKVELARLYVSTGQFQPALATLDDVPTARFPLEALPVNAAALIAVGKREAASNLIDRAKG